MIERVARAFDACVATPSSHGQGQCWSRATSRLMQNFSLFLYQGPRVELEVAYDDSTRYHSHLFIFFFIISWRKGNFFFLQAIKFFFHNLSMRGRNFSRTKLFLLKFKMGIDSKQREAARFSYFVLSSFFVIV